MHNSKNSAYRKDIFTSILLAQAKLLGISADFNNLYDLNNKIEADTKYASGEPASIQSLSN